MRLSFRQGPALPALLILLPLLGCTEDDRPDPADHDDVDSIGAITGSFSCPIVEADTHEVDMGPADLNADLADERFVAGLRTQGCWARVLDADRGRVVSIQLLQQTSFTEGQILELNIPTEITAWDDEWTDAPPRRDTATGDRVIFSGQDGFASFYKLDELPDDEPEVFARNAGGAVLVSAWSSEEGDLVAGTIETLRMGVVR